MLVFSRKVKVELISGSKTTKSLKYWSTSQVSEVMENKKDTKKGKSSLLNDE